MYFFENHGMNDTTYFSYGHLERGFPAHLHLACELICVRSGSLFLSIDQKKYTLNKDELAFVFPNQIHGFVSNEKIDLYILIFSPEIIDDFFQAYKGYVPANNIISMPKWLHYDDLNCIYSKKGALYTLCGILLSTTKMEKSDSLANATILQKVFSYIDANFREDCSLKCTAEALKYDYTYLSRLFSKYTDVSFTTYLNNYRISQACAMLEKNEYTISEIAYRCGYMSLRTFHRNFQRVMHCSPHIYCIDKGGL